MRRSDGWREPAAAAARGPDRRRKQHIEYVPTQVFTEYVRYHMAAPDGKPVDGIRYLSSWDRRPCVVLFLDADDWLKSRQDRPQALAYLPGSEKTTRLDLPRK
jgi:RES domain